MALGDVLSGIGSAIGKGAEVVGESARELAPGIAAGIAGDGPQIAEERRKRQYAQEDEQIAAKAQELNSQLDAGRKYGTLTPAQQQQYVDQITNLYSHPRHAPKLMDNLRKIIHPQGAVAGAATPSAPQLPSGIPEGGTAAADTKIAAGKVHGRPVPGVKPFAGPDGKYYQPMLGGDGTIHNEEVPDYTPPAAKENPFNVAMTAFKESKGLPPTAHLDQEQLTDFYGSYQKLIEKDGKTHLTQRDPNNPEKWVFNTFDAKTGELESSIPDALPPRYLTPTETSSSRKDAFGNVTTSSSTRKPVLPPTTASAAKGAATAPIPTSGAPVPSKPSVGAILRPQAPAVRPSAVPAPSRATPAAAMRPPVPSTGGAKQLDANGKIPNDGSNRNVREFAQQLIDDKDVDKIPAAARGPAAALAREYGWEQGKFTPREQTQINEASSFLNQLQSSPSLKVLDSFISREKIAKAIDPKGGMIGNIAALNLTPDESRFVREYNAVVGTIQGLSSITRSGRPTEAAVNRLKAELPSVLQSSGSADAKARIDQLLKEITIAKQSSRIGGMKDSTSVASKGRVSLIKAKSLPQFKGKSDDEIRTAAKQAGYEVY